MPQAKVYGIRERLVPIRDVLSEAINESISDAFKFPRDRRLQRFFPMDREDFIYHEDVRIQMSGNGKREPHIHSAAIAFDRRIDKFFHIGEGNDLIEFF